MNGQQLSLFPGKVHEGRKTAVHPNSILARYLLLSEGKAQKIKKGVFDILAQKREPMTRRQLSVILRKEPSSLCPATNELEK